MITENPNGINSIQVGWELQLAPIFCVGSPDGLPLVICIVVSLVGRSIFVHERVKTGRLQRMIQQPLGNASGGPFDARQAGRGHAQ